MFRFLAGSKDLYLLQIAPTLFRAQLTSHSVAQLRRFFSLMRAVREAAHRPHLVPSLLMSGAMLTLPTQAITAYARGTFDFALLH